MLKRNNSIANILKGFDRIVRKLNKLSSQLAHEAEVKAEQAARYTAMADDAYHQHDQALAEAQRAGDIAARIEKFIS